MENSYAYEEQEIETEYREFLSNKEAILILSICYYLKYLKVNQGPELEFSQKKIADLVGISASQVSRYIKKAEERNWLEREYCIKVPPVYRKFLPAFVSVPHLSNQIRHRIGLNDKHRITVVPGPEYYQVLQDKKLREEDVLDFDRSLTLDLVAKAAADQLGPVLSGSVKPVKGGSQDGHISVISWGRTMRKMAENILLSPTEAESAEAYAKVYPVIGNFTLVPDPRLIAKKEGMSKLIEDTFNKSVRSSANTNARRLARSMGLSPLRALMSVAVVQTARENLKACAPVFEADSTLVELYGRKFYENDEKMEGDIWRAHTFLTSVGIPYEKPESVGKRAAGSEKIDARHPLRCFGISEPGNRSKGIAQGRGRYCRRHF